MSRARQRACPRKRYASVEHGSRSIDSLHRERVRKTSGKRRKTASLPQFDRYSQKFILARGDDVSRGIVVKRDLHLGSQLVVWPGDFLAVDDHERLVVTDDHVGDML